MRRLALIFGILAILVLIPFLIWGDEFEAFFTIDGSREWLARFGKWAWLAGIVLLIADLVLPLPNTLVIAGLGYHYGIVAGGLLGATGSIFSGLLAYGLCRGFGRGAALKIAHEEGLAEGERLFARSGGWIVALSRWLPMIPEVVSCAAGLSRMRFRVYLAALVCGSAPLGFFYAAIGRLGHEHLTLAFVLSIFVPPALWLVVGRLSIFKDVDTQSDL